MPRIIYGTDTGSVEDFYQCVALDIPNGVDLDTIEELAGKGAWESQSIVTIEDVAAEIRHIFPILPHIHPSVTKQLQEELISRLYDGLGLND